MISEGTTFAEFIRYFPHLVPEIDFGRGFIKNDLISLDFNEYEVPRLKGKLRLQWVTIEDAGTIGSNECPEFEVRMSSESPDWEKIQRETDRSFYYGLGVHGIIEVPKELAVENILVLQKERKPLDEEGPALQTGFRLLHLCLRLYNEVIDAHRIARADDWTPDYRCIREPYELVSFRGMQNLIEPTRRGRLLDFADTSLVCTPDKKWVPAFCLITLTYGAGPPNPKVKELTQEFLKHRRTNWASYLLDSLEYTLDGELSLAVITANVAVELAFKELLELLLQEKRIQVNDKHVRDLLGEVSFNRQLRILLPLVADGACLPNEVVTRCNELRTARNNLIHWGGRSSDIRKVLSWVDAAREACVHFETWMAQIGKSPTVLHKIE